ncbi:ABC transporter B family member 25 [Symbiodinium microadriaticum]|uniref:ABC transporter B family member 25 n=1 Tax=Symbiodinium microadriaticum TaxID=2951 RepID=A0A1Q9CPW4_SYMMI|nr:ABC transporter B family member 25 [Symbiodinium microadriaticum]
MSMSWGSATPTIKHIKAANKVISELHKTMDVLLRILPTLAEEGIFISISDASLANDDEKSQSGYIVSFVKRSIMDGELAPMSILCWRSHKLRRVVKASLGSEALAMDDGMSELEWLRAMYAEVCVPEAAVTDAARYGPRDESVIISGGRQLEDKPGIWSLGSRHPQIHPSAYVAPGASIIGTVTLRKDASVWFNCTLRGDNEVITIGEGSDIQDNSVLHCDPGKPLVVGRNCLVGHQVCLHGCRIGENCLIGMRTTILDNVVIGSNCFVAAGSFIGEGRSFPDNSLIGGNPAKRIADLETDPAKMAAVMNAASSKGLAANRPEAPAGYVENKERYTKDLNLSSSLCVGSCIIIRSACDAWQPVLTGAVFNLVNGDKHEVERESHFLHFLCSWTFGCSGRLPLARSVILGLMLAAVVQGVARVIGDGVKKEMRNRQNSEMRAAMFEHLLAQDQALYDTLRQRDLVRKVELRALSEVTEWVWGMTADTVKLATQMIFLFAISPLMTLAYTVLLPMMEQIMRRFWERSLRAQLRREDGLHAVSSYVVHEAVYMIKTVKCFSREDKHVALVSLAAKDAMKEASPNGGPLLSRLRGVRHGIAHLLPDITQRAVYCFCLWCGLVWMERDFSAGDMTAYLLLIQQVGGLVQRVRHQFWELQWRHDLLLDHFEFMDRTPQVVSGMHTAEVGGDIEFREVEFAYPARPDVQVLRGVSFEMARGQMTALVGASGSGKSTIASLLFRHYDPLVGEISVDKVKLCDWNTSALHSQMALVAQQPLLFDTSIRNNLTYGCRRDVLDEEIEAAARMASAHDFILGFPAGYDTYVGDQGAHMSGGQKQRLSIARAVILKPQILVLDEATSALDAEAEGAVQDALDTVMSGRTTLVIAHRLSTIRNAHSIVCMRDGQIVERGSPKELLAKQGYYWSLVRRQVCTLDDLSDFNLTLDQHPAETLQVSPASQDKA